MQLTRLPFLATVLLISSPPADAMPARAIYRCKAADVVTFSDRPCAAGAQEYKADSSRISTYAAPPAAQTAAAKPKQKQRPKKAAPGPARASQAKHEADCDRLRGALRDIREKMRRGYGAKEGERLKERQAKLEQRRRVQRCR